MREFKLTRMRILCVHQNFPGQYLHLAPALVQRGHEVTALTLRESPTGGWGGVRWLRYGVQRGSARDIHPWVADFETKIIRGEACWRAARQLQAAGYEPDVIVAHPGWGESLFLKEVWPQAPLGIYCEFYYQAAGADVGFDPEFAAADASEVCRLRLKNLNSSLHFELASAGLAPTHWQASTFPEPFRGRISVIHDGIDTATLGPRSDVRLALAGGRHLAPEDEVITFVNRNLEPYRGYHSFMRALPAILARRPRARVLIVGGDGVSYGARPKQGQTWKEIFAAEARAKIPAADWARVYFLGRVPHRKFIALLQRSSLHVYLTYPFVLSWSLLEAMSVGCAIVASDTAPVREAIQHDQTGRLVDFFDVDALAAAVCALLDDEPARLRLGAAARAFARDHYDLQSVCLPRQLAWVEALADLGSGPRPVADIIDRTPSLTATRP